LALAPASLTISLANSHDSTAAVDALKPIDITGKNVLLDKAYLVKVLQDYIVAHGATWVTPPKSNSKEPWEYDKELYKQPSSVERFFSRIKEARRIATRYEKLSCCFELMVTMFSFVAFSKYY